MLFPRENILFMKKLRLDTLNIGFKHNTSNVEGLSNTAINLDIISYKQLTLFLHYEISFK